MSQKFDDDVTIVQLSETPPAKGHEPPFTPVAVVPGRAAPNNARYVVQQTSLEDYSSGVNPLVNSAAYLIMEMIRLREGHMEDMEALRDRLEAEVRSFTAQTRANGITEGQSTAARYLLCTALDESVTTSRIPGAQAEWSQRSLLSSFHNETWGGERFFQVLERTMQQPAANLYLLELIYLLISLGFEGKYRLEERGPVTLEGMRDSLFRQIRLLRGEASPDLSKKITISGVKNRIYTYVPLWIVAAVVSVLLTVSFGGFYYILNMKASPLLTGLESHAPKGDLYVRPPVVEESEAESEQGTVASPEGEATAPATGEAANAKPVPVTVGTDNPEKGK